MTFCYKNCIFLCHSDFLKTSTKMNEIEIGRAQNGACKSENYSRFCNGQPFVSQRTLRWSAIRCPLQRHGAPTTAEKEDALG